MGAEQRKQWRKRAHGGGDFGNRVGDARKAATLTRQSGARSARCIRAGRGSRRCREQLSSRRDDGGIGNSSRGCEYVAMEEFIVRATLSQHLRQQAAAAGGRTAQAAYRGVERTRVLGKGRRAS